MTKFTFDLEAELGNIARLGAQPLPAADPSWVLPRMERFAAWCKNELGEEVAANDLVVLAHNIHIYLLELLVGEAPQEMRSEILEAAVFSFESSLRRRKAFKS